MRKNKELRTVSIIVPLYHGVGYVGQILKQIEQNAVCAGDISIQLILYNDCPEENIRIEEKKYSFEIQVINAEKNHGIHGARVRGLEYCIGEYVLFLDQDDLIQENYVADQYSKIGNADAVVCRLINGKRLHYTDTFQFEEVITKEFMLNHWCPIVSPGQVLLRKEAIPNIWRENILKNNGADDYFLWLCMMAEGKRFVLNQEVLFKHVITGRNTSENTNLMMDSEEEMIEVLKREAVFSESDLLALDGLKLSLRKIHVKQLDTQRWALNCLNRLYCNLFDKKYIYGWIREHKGKRIAIYGAGELGEGLCFFLQNQGLFPICYLDQNAAFILSEIPAYKVEDADMELDGILLTVSAKGLKETLKCRFGCEVIEIGEIVCYG